MLGNILNLPLIGGHTSRPPAPAPAPSASEPSSATPAQGGTSQSPAAADTSGTPASGARPGAQPAAASHARGGPSTYQASSGSFAPAKADDDIAVEAWARRAAVEVQRNEQFASMLSRIAKPEASESIVLMQNHREGTTDLASATAAYGENDAYDAPPARDKAGA
ncbi:hypothetical protein JF546_06895 [Nitratireductor aquimarinus]|uniref:hypothetical protein n=1 Tax=Nitratireductor aquimarinus TaxID=889300 RepID=UPI001A8DA207|nr:hypothetical protein [Nitratireductor aquimarinus]MBN8242732.1 hypothetical protein [Nitratireductor aquimarinus]MBY6131832.1 hypothetical protein [Nitratireductor aquimarinus]MCA1301369.1 hypothetical protein [Nitratireductor aquimarinus]